VILVANYRITYFLEDLGHQDMIVSLVKKVLDDYHNEQITIHHDIRNARGGDVIIRSLTQYLRELQAHRHPGGNPDLLIITRDTNRVGRVGREQELRRVITRIGYPGQYVLALPEPYIEAWYFADPAAVQRVFELPDLPIIPYPSTIRWHRVCRRYCSRDGPLQRTTQHTGIETIR